MDEGDDHRRETAREEIVGMAALTLEYEDTKGHGASFSKHQSVEICSLFVYPQYRGAGIGRQAFVAVEEHAKRMGAKTVLLKTGTFERNIPWYQRMGYSAFAVVPDYWTGWALSVGKPDDLKALVLRGSSSRIHFDLATSSAQRRSADIDTLLYI